MKEILLFLILMACALLIFLFIVFKRGSKYNTLLFIIGIICFLSIITIFFSQGTTNMSSNFARIIKNSKPKSAEEVYTLLFKQPANNCLTVINFKDQFVPKFDCCIWMELTVCPKELKRIILNKKYKETIWSESDSTIILQPFSDRPSWWIPQRLGDSLTKLNFIFNEDNEQSLFFGKDSMHIYLCDMAL